MGSSGLLAWDARAAGQTWAPGAGFKTQAMGGQQTSGAGETRLERASLPLRASRS